MDERVASAIAHWAPRFTANGVTPADFALVAQRSAQLAFDRALVGGSPEIVAGDVLAAIDLTRPSVSHEASLRFEDEATTYSRL